VEREDAFYVKFPGTKVTATTESEIKSKIYSWERKGTYKVYEIISKIF
jgi:hypothetical protein